MEITRVSSITGAKNTRNIDITDEQLEHWQISGKLIQDVMPNISDDDREFILTGITPDEWDKFVT